LVEKYPHFVQVLNLFLWDNIPKGFRQDFKWTTIKLNVDFVCNIHRDTGNAGPSCAASFGNYSDGGELMVWVGDKGVGKTHLNQLTEDKGYALDTFEKVACSMVPRHTR
jgi:hypothetical protein